MKRVVTSDIAFWIGVISIFVGIISYFTPGRILGIRSISFIHFANAWFLIAVISLLSGIYNKMSSGEKKEETKKEE